MQTAGSFSAITRLAASERNTVRPRLRSTSRPHALVLVLVLLAAMPAAHASVLYRTFTAGTTTVHYAVVLPPQFNGFRSYPGVLGFGGGSQSMDTVAGVIERYFRDEAERRGYIVVVPAAPDGQLFFKGGERILPAFLQALLNEYPIAGGKFHVAGPSNGGISALHVAATYPQYFLSVTAFPGYLPEETPERVAALTGLCINMFVGEFDPYGWQPTMEAQARDWHARGIAAQFSLEKGQAHRIETLEGAHAARLFDLFEQAQRGCAAAAHPAAP